MTHGWEGAFNVVATTHACYIVSCRIDRMVLIHIELYRNLSIILYMHTCIPISPTYHTGPSRTLESYPSIHPLLAQTKDRNGDGIPTARNFLFFPRFVWYGCVGSGWTVDALFLGGGEGRENQKRRERERERDCTTTYIHVYQYIYICIQIHTQIHKPLTSHSSS